MDETPASPTTSDRSSYGDNSTSERGRSATISHMNGAAAIGLFGGGGGNNGGNSATRLPTRRPQTQISPSIEQKSIIPPQVLTLTIHKDSNGYGMKVSGDNPVYVESVKSGGAAQKAGLVAGDMILKVNGVEVRLEKHTTVVQLIKSHLVVELTVQRSQKMQRPNSVATGPSTPLPQRDRITGPQPVDNEKRREMEYAKIKTLRLMLDQEKKNLENLQSGSGASNRQDRSRAETNIRKLQEQLRQVGGEDPSLQFLTTPTSAPPPSIITSPIYPLPSPQHQHSSPAFLSRFPRSLSSLSLGTRKKPEKDILPSPLAANPVLQSPDQHQIPLLSHHHQHHQIPSPQQQQQQSQMLLNITPVKKKFTGSERNLKDEIPPPLPQRNPTRKIISDDGGGGGQQHHSSDWRRNIPISDLDHSMSAQQQQQNQMHHQNPKTTSSSGNLSGGGASPSSIGGSKSSSSSSSSSKKRLKTKTKALSDPKMSTQMFLQMEKEHGSLDDTISPIPPPLPPRQPGMLEENQNLINSSKMMASNSNIPIMSNSSPTNLLGSGFHGPTNHLRALPNSIETLLNYPLVATCTTIRGDNSLAFPLSQRPNIVQKLQHHQQTQQLQQQQQQQQQQQHSNNLHHNLPSAPTHSSASVNKSSVLGQTPPQASNLTKHRRVVSSPEHVQDRLLDRHNKSSSGSWELVEKDNERTPPGTPPPPYLAQLHSHSHSFHGDEADRADSELVSNNANSFGTNVANEIIAAQANTIQKEIILMDDDEVSDQECIVDEQAPFNYLARLLKPENTVYLAVFLNYLLSNCDPAPLLFYLITELYKEGTVKDMRKWAYEIHSTFLVPNAPLLWFSVDISLAREVDNILQKEHDKVEILKKVFWKSRKKAKEKINEQLRIFQQRRIEGMGTIYGPTDQQLSMAKGDKAKEQKIFEETLLPKLQDLVDQLERDQPQIKPEKLALSSALSTVLHRIFITRSNPGSPIDSCHHFVSREKSFKSRLMGKNRKMVVLGHPLVLRQYYEVTDCNHCQTIIWGVSPQGYHCTDCKLNIHRLCSKVLEESCPGPVPQKRKEQHTDNKISKFMGKIRPTHHFIQNERTRRMDEENVEDSHLNDRPHSTGIVRQPSDRKPDSSNAATMSNTTSVHGQNDLATSQSVDSNSGAIDIETDSKKERSKSKSAPVSVNRSESYKERLSQKRNRNNRRKTSDPSLTKPNDEQESGLSNANFSASCSNSSLSSGSFESPSISLEHVSGTQTAHVTSRLPPIAASAAITVEQWANSDDEVDILETDWISNVPAEILQTLSDAEKKRQEIINEIYQTERNHVRTLKLLDRIFMRPLFECGILPSDHLQLLFPPGLLSLKDIHSSFESKLKQRRIEEAPIVGRLGDLLIDMFEGKSSEKLREHAAQVCAYQQIALEALKERRRKDETLHRLLVKAEAHKSCRRLQLKDLLPTVLQRLTKYPLLFENLVNVTKRVHPDNSAELDAIQRALDSSKQILVYVNQAVKAAEDAHKLQTIQRKLDKSSIDKDLNDLRNLDLTQHKLVYDGHLQMKKNPSIQLHGLLFENMMILLQKQDDKYMLKNFPHTCAGGGEGNISPVTYFDQQTLVRQSAVDKNTFFLIITKTSQMLELKAPSSSECKTWFKHISDAAEQYKPRSKSIHDVIEDPATTIIPNSNAKESPDVTTERNLSDSQVTNTAQKATVAIETANSVTNSTNNNSSSSSTKAGQPNSQQSSESKTVSSDSQKDVDNRLERNDRTSTSEDNAVFATATVEQRDSSHLDRDLRKRDSDSMVFSNNANNTRTLMQSSVLVDPREIQISISPAHIAEPVLTPAERLRRLDGDIRKQLMEKQRIICDMFRVPHEHFAAIVDVASQPEAPKDTSDIVLAAFAHVQTLTEILSEHMKVRPEQEIAAVSTTICDRCNELNRHSMSPLPLLATVTKSFSNCSTISAQTIKSSIRDIPEDIIIQEDDGYCQIDELRLPAIHTRTPSQSNDTNTVIVTKSESTSAEETQLSDETRDIQDDDEKTRNTDETNQPTDNVTASDTSDAGNSCKPPSTASDDTSIQNEHIEVNETYDTTTPIEKYDKENENEEKIEPNQTSHVFSLGPSVPCHLLSGIVTALSSQISLLLPKISERDLERERLRRENLHLRELLNAMHERQRVKDEKETPGCSETISAENIPS